MAATPNLDELRAATESGKIADAFRLLINQDKAEDESFIARMGEESSQLRAVIEKKEQTLTEAAAAFTSFNPVTATAQAGLREIQLKNRMKLDLLGQLLVLSRQSFREKEELLERLDDAEDDDTD